VQEVACVLVGLLYRFGSSLEEQSELARISPKTDSERVPAEVLRFRSDAPETKAEASQKRRAGARVPVP